MAKKQNIEPASVFQRSGIRAIRARAIEVLLYYTPYLELCIDNCMCLQVTIDGIATVALTAGGQNDQHPIV